MLSGSLLPLGIVILNWKNPGDTLRCLAALYASSYTNFHPVVVENGSQDDSADVLRQTYPELDLLVSPKNLGYTGGNNLGMKHLLSLGMDCILLLNDDAVLEPNALAELTKSAVGHPQAGFFGPKILALSDVGSSGRVLPTLPLCSRDAPQILLSTGGFFENGYLPRNRGMGEIDHGQYEYSIQADFLSGCALLVRRQVIESIGLLDEAFFAYHEEIEWCYRASQSGFTAQYVPTAQVWHPDTRDRDSGSESVTYYTTRNSLLFAQKHHLGWRVTGSLLAQYSRRLLSWNLRPKWRRKHPPAQRQALRQALSDFALGRFGQRR